MPITRTILVWSSCILFLFAGGSLWAEKNQDNDNRKHEIGSWVGASNPLPGTPIQRLLDTSLGGGMFYRAPWPSILWTEVGMSYSVYLSPSEQALTTIPVYAALAYKLPIDLPIQFFLKGGGGQAYVVARPANTARWNPLIYGGFEASFVAGKKVRIGLRVDYNRIMESNLDVPGPYRFPLSSPFDDPRLFNPNNFQLRDAEFFHFGIMVSLLL